ncbi:MAG: hydratase, partial [Candidatus Ventricola sp.]
RNFPNREGSKPGEGQMAGVALMDARSIAATAINGGRLTAADEIEVEYTTPKYFFDKSVYDKRVYNGFGHAEPEHELKMGPNIKDWPKQPELSEDLLLKVVSYITDPVTTTDELIPSGETSSYRSNPLRLAEFALSRKDPAYVGNAKAVHAFEVAREAGEQLPDEVKAVYAALERVVPVNPADTVIASTIYANKPGDGSAREQAASCQRVLGGGANIAREYATKRYRSNCINWGMAPLLVKDETALALGDWVFVPGIRKAILGGVNDFDAYVVKADGSVTKLPVSTGDLTADERQIIADGCLINYYRNH